jgi:hypothetical protein
MSLSDTDPPSLHRVFDEYAVDRVHHAEVSTPPIEDFDFAM